MVTLIVFVIIIILMTLFVSKLEGGSHGSGELEEWKRLEHRKLSDKDTEWNEY